MKLSGPLEIVSATGTLGTAGLHIHVSVADQYGAVYGGHLLENCIVASTVELVIGDLSNHWSFERIYDPKTGYNELNAKHKR
jgi:predicted DNA-binding protein with PD1-like motif